MSFSFQFFGPKKEVAAKVSEYAASGDTSQVDAVKALFADLVDKAPEDVNVSIEASGHHSYESQGYENANIDLKIRLKHKDAKY